MVFDRASQKLMRSRGIVLGIRVPSVQKCFKGCSLFTVILAELNNVSNCLCAVRLIIIENRRLELEQQSVGKITRAVVLQTFSFVAQSQQSCVTAAVRRPFRAKMVGFKLLNLSTGLKAWTFSKSAMTKRVWRTESYLSEWFCTQDRLWRVP